MKKPKHIKYLAAAILVKGKYILVRSAYKDDFNVHGYYFPGCKKSDKLSDSKQLTQQIFRKYKLRIVVDDFLGDVYVNMPDGRTAVLYLYKCLLKKETSINSYGVIAKLYSPEEFRTLKFDTADGYLAQRVSLFYRVYQGEKKDTPLLKKAQQKALLFYNCLLYNSDKVARQDLVDFAGLCGTNATIEEIEEAFYWIAHRSNVSFNKFIQDVRGVK